MTYRKKLIEVALPLEAINVASAREKTVRHGHPSNLHRWWARRPLAACRAVLFGQMVDDPSSWPSEWPTDAAQEAERLRLFRIIEDLVLWENSSNERVIGNARREIAVSFARGRTADGHADARDAAVLVKNPKATDVNLYLAEVAPPVHDPFAGGGSIPLEAQRLGLRAIATDLNPVAVLINKALIEIPPKFAGMPAVNPESRSQRRQDWKGAQGLAEDVRYYSGWMRDEAAKRIGHLYPKVTITAELAEDRKDLEPLVGQEFTVIAWLWARTVRSPNPAFAGVHVPLAASFLLCAQPGKEAYVAPEILADGYRFRVMAGKPVDLEATKNGTKLARGAKFRCLMSGTPMPSEHVKEEGRAGRMGTRLMAVVAEGVRGRLYLSPTPEMEAVAASAVPQWEPDGAFVEDGRAFTPYLYGLKEWRHLFTRRQLVAMTTFSDLVLEAQARAKADALSATMAPAETAFVAPGDFADNYANAIATYLAMAVSKAADSNNSLCPWEPVAQCSRQLFGRQLIPILWDFAEANPLHDSSGGVSTNVDGLLRSFVCLPSQVVPGSADQADAALQTVSAGKLVSTDPPYYDNVPYADLSDFFYVWLRRSIKPIYPKIFSTLAVPKSNELVATSYRHGGRESAETFFLDGMTQAMHRLVEQVPDALPVAIYYAFKQAETRDAEGTSSTGWEAFLDAVLKAGFTVCGTWPMRTESTVALKTNQNALASSIVLICRKRPSDAPTTTRADFRRLLRQELPAALKALQHGNIAPVDMAQASIGPGMAIFSRHAKVLEADGTPMTVRTALQLINQALDEYLTEQEGEFDGDTRFALTWFETRQYDPGPFGEAETLAKARNVSVSGVAEAGILSSAAGKVRLLRRSELPDDWDPETDKRLTVWEAAQHLIWRLENKGESAAADLLAHLRATAAPARDLAYRLYTTCERKGWAEEARAYNGLVVAWPELEKLASGVKTTARPTQQELL